MITLILQGQCLVMSIYGFVQYVWLMPKVVFCYNFNLLIWITSHLYFLIQMIPLGYFAPTVCTNSTLNVLLVFQLKNFWQQAVFTAVYTNSNRITRLNFSTKTVIISVHLICTHVAVSLPIY